MFVKCFTVTMSSCIYGVAIKEGPKFRLELTK